MKKTKIKGWALLAAGMNTLQGVYLYRGEASLAKEERAGIYKTYILPVEITFTPPKKHGKK